MSAAVLPPPETTEQQLARERRIVLWQLLVERSLREPGAGPISVNEIVRGWGDGGDKSTVALDLRNLETFGLIERAGGVKGNLKWRPIMFPFFGT